MVVTCLGEVMLELRPSTEAGFLEQGIGGDTFNTAVMLSRAGIATGFATRLSSDPFSLEIIALAECEKLDTQMMFCDGASLPGLYMIKNDRGGEREFFYWRDSSSARSFFENMSMVGRFTEIVRNSEWLYLSGITTAVMAQNFEEHFIAAIQSVKAAGVKIAFDPNYRPALWADKNSALHWHELMLGYSDMVLPTLVDEQTLWGARHPQDVIERCASAGVQSVVVKCAGATAVAWKEGETAERSSAYRGPVVDTTGAGDAFNAGFLAESLNKASLSDCLDRAHQVASQVLSVRGALP